MYKNLSAEMARAGLSRRELAKKIGCTPGTLTMKLNGKSTLSLLEAYEIKKILGVDMPLEELFHNSEEVG